MKLDITRRVFFLLLRAGLWEREVQLLPFGKIDYEHLFQLSEEQSVVGLVAAGIEHVSDTKLTKKDVLQLISRTVQLEQRNSAMDYFIGVISDRMRDAGITTVLMKGQGVAQCYERPLWRANGDVDFLTDANHYQKAKDFLTQLAVSVDKEEPYNKHLGMTIDPWVVELHGTLRSLLWKSVERTVDDVQQDIFEKGMVRTWHNGGTDILLPGVAEDAFYIFMHFVAHFFKGGIGFRQICDWCRLLWTYSSELDLSVVEARLKQSGLMSEWKAFGSLAVEYLGMPADVMPFYSPSARWRRKASRIVSFIFETGNFGHNRDSSYYRERSFLVRKAISFWRYTCDSVKHFFIFPWDSMKVWWNRIAQSVCVAVKGE